jgi:hypothetical protein
VLSVALKVSDERGGLADLPLGALDRGRRLAQRYARSQIEADGDGRELALVADRQGRDRLRRPTHEGGERHLLAGQRRLQVDAVQRLGIALERRQNLHHNVVAVELREILRDLALPEGVVERIVDQLRLNAEPSGLIAVDRQSQRRPIRLLVAGDVAEFLERLQLFEHARRPGVKFLQVGVLQGVLELRAGRSPAHVDVLRRL